MKKLDLLIKDKKRNRSVLALSRKRMVDVKEKNGVLIITIDDVEKHLEDNQDPQNAIDIFNKANLDWDEKNLVKQRIKQ